MGTVGARHQQGRCTPPDVVDPQKDFAPIAVTGVNVMVVNAGKAKATGINNVADFIRVAKANPGKVQHGVSGNGTSIHMAGELFGPERHRTIHFPYGGSGPAADVAGRRRHGRDVRQPASSMRS
jgi:tripartite-type tricarboxylate transporter receptor subunit TctC